MANVDWPGNRLYLRLMAKGKAIVDKNAKAGSSPSGEHGIDLLRIDRARHRATVHKLLPSTSRSVFDGTTSPDGQKVAFLSASDDEQVRQFTQVITRSGTVPEPRQVATFPRANNDDSGGLRLQSWD